MSYAAARLRSLAWRHPEWWVYAVAAGAWAALAVAALPDATAHAGHVHPAGDGATSGLPHAALMSLAMMAPLAAPAARYVATTSFRSRRQRALVTFLAGYLATWTVVAAAIAVVVAAVTDAAGAAAAGAIAVGLAGAWQLARPKRSALARCRRAASVAGEGWRATRDCARFGVVHAGRCTVTCGSLMAAAAALGHSLPVMAVVFGLQVHERAARAYRPLVSAVGLALVAAVTVAV
jgi:predicted metal-binding membrane protein